MLTAQVMATDALQEATESYLHEFFTGKNPEEFVTELSRIHMRMKC